MKNSIINILIGFNFVRCLLHIIIYCLHPNHKIIKADINQWLKSLKKKYSDLIGLIYLLGFFPEYRNLFYYRIGAWKYLLNIYCREISTLVIDTKEIGEGLFLNHGFATAIGAKSIGKNCRINHQVTIGDYHGGKPTILDNVRIHSGAIIIGEIVIGNNAIIGANATVLKDVPDNSTVYPAQGRMMKWTKTTSYLSSTEINEEP